MIRLVSYTLYLLLCVFLIAQVYLVLSAAAQGAQLPQILTSSLWNYPRELFGALSMVSGTAIVAGVALLIALPIGVFSAIFLSEYLTGKRRATAKVLIELLASVPSIVIGLVGVLFLQSLLLPLHEWMGLASSDSLFTAGCLLSLMLLPTATSLMDDALRCVPRSHREAAYGLGFSREQVTLRVVLPQARSGIVAASCLALGRSLGETVAVFLVVGRADRPFSSWSWKALFEPGQTITSKLGGSEIAIAYGDPNHWSALMAVAIILWLCVSITGYFSSRLQAETP